MRFRPSPVPTLLSAIGLAILLGLGTWQARKIPLQQARLVTIRERLTHEKILDLGPSPDPEAVAWTRATLTGSFEPAIFRLSGRFECSEPGYDVVQPFVTAGGAKILVNRGFVPLKDEIPPAADGEIAGLLLDVAEFRQAADVPPIPAEGERPERWPRDAYAAVSTRVPGVAPIALVAGPELAPTQQKDCRTLPIVGWYPTPKVIPHGQYAGTWFLIAGTLVAIWIVAGFMGPKERSKEEL